MKTTNITVFEKTIRIDADGRFCLNDIHKAAMANGKATESQRPGAFLQSDGVKGFVAELIVFIASKCLQAAVETSGL